jgi:hypothetical protein
MPLSQGGAYSAAMSKVLTDAGYTVEVEYYLAPKQPLDIPETNAKRTVQYGSNLDGIAPQADIPYYSQPGGGLQYRSSVPAAILLEKKIID